MSGPKTLVTLIAWVQNRAPFFQEQSKRSKYLGVAGHRRKLFGTCLHGPERMRCEQRRSCQMKNLAHDHGTYNARVTFPEDAYRWRTSKENMDLENIYRRSTKCYPAHKQMSQNRGKLHPPISFTSPMAPDNPSDCLGSGMLMCQRTLEVTPHWLESMQSSKPHYCAIAHRCGYNSEDSDSAPRTNGSGGRLGAG